MSNVTKTVKSSGGDYTSLNAALAGQSADLTANCGGSGSAGILTIECYAMQDTTAAGTGAGYTTSADYYINITVPTAERHQGIPSTDKYRIYNNGNNVLTIEENFVRIDGLQLYQGNDGWPYSTITLGFDRSSVTDIRISNCIFKQTSTHASYKCKAINGNVDHLRARIWNCIFIDYTETAGSNYTVDLGNWYEADDPHEFYNNTFINCVRGIRSNHSDSVLIKNTLFKDGSSNTSGTFAAGSGYNATDQSSLGYTVTDGATGDRTSQTFAFVDADNDNFHLASNDGGARDYGTSSVNSLFTTDIDGETRSGTWDIGADEYVAAAGASVLPVFDYHFNNMRS